MTSLVQQFDFDILRIRRGEKKNIHLYDDNFAVHLRARLPPGRDDHDVLAALDAVRSTIGAWIKSEWHNRLFICPEDRALLTQMQGRQQEEVYRPIFVDAYLTPLFVADHLLTAVCEPRLRGHNVIVDLVRAQIRGRDWVEASLDEAFVAKYLSRCISMPTLH